MTPAWAPARFLALAAVISLLLAAATFVVATQQPWLGVEFKPNADGTGLQVIRVHPDSPNRGALVPGSVVVGLATELLEMRFDAKLLPVGEVDLPNFATFNRYVANHKAVWQVVTASEFAFVLADYSRVRGATVAVRPIGDLPWRFWALPAAGFAALLIGIGIAVYRPQLPATPVIVAGGIGMFTAALLAGVFSTRELTLPPLWLRLGIDEVNPGSELVAFFIAALLWYYPRPRYRLPVASICALCVAVVWANEWFQLKDLPPNTYTPHFLITYLSMVVFSIIQWRQAREDAFSRAALKWFLLALIIPLGIFVALSVAPVVYGKPSLIAKHDTFFLGPLAYIGLALGIARYRLFDLERWWLEVWLWLGGGLLVIGIDVLLITFFHLADLLALGFALILAGWVYLPLRQWLFRRILRPARTRLDDHFPLLIETLFQDRAGRTFGERWYALVQRVFQPMEFKTSPQPVLKAALAESGIALQIPAFDGQETYELRFREQGRKLYTPRDVALADSLLALTHRAAALWQAREEGVHTERRRIQRDLHDDVAARLLSLMHRASEPAQYQQAHEALAALRQAIYALDEQKPVVLPDLLTDLQAELRERARTHSIEVEWREPPMLPEINLGARAQINLQHIFSEAASNAIRHCSPTRFKVAVRLDNPRLHLDFCNDGAILRMEDWVAGKGIRNIRERIAELGGEAIWTTVPVPGAADQTCCMQLRIPLPAETHQ